MTCSVFDMDKSRSEFIFYRVEIVSSEFFFRLSALLSSRDCAFHAFISDHIKQTINITFPPVSQLYEHPRNLGVPVISNQRHWINLFLGSMAI